MNKSILNKPIISILGLMLLLQSVLPLTASALITPNDISSADRTYVTNWAPIQYKSFIAQANASYKSYVSNRDLTATNKNLKEQNITKRNDALEDYRELIDIRDQHHSDWQRQYKLAENYYKKFQIYKDRGKAFAKNALIYKKAADRALIDYSRQVEMAEDAEKDRKKQKNIADDYYSLYLIYIDINKTTANTYLALYKKHNTYASNYKERRDKHYGYADNYYGMHLTNQRNYDSSKLKQWENEEISDANYRSYVTHNRYANNYKGFYNTYKTKAANKNADYKRYKTLVTTYANLQHRYNSYADNFLAYFKNYSNEAIKLERFQPTTFLDTVKELASNLATSYLKWRAEENEMLKKGISASVKKQKGLTLTTQEQADLKNYDEWIIGFVAGTSGPLKFAKSNGGDVILNKMQSAVKNVVYKHRSNIVGSASKTGAANYGTEYVTVFRGLKNLTQAQVDEIKTVGDKSGALRAGKTKPNDTDFTKTFEGYNQSVFALSAGSKDHWLHTSLSKDIAIPRSIGNQPGTYNVLYEARIPISEFGNNSIIAELEYNHLDIFSPLVLSEKEISYWWHLPKKYIEDITVTSNP